MKIEQREFHLFAQLPVAIRLRIYSFVQTPYSECHIHSIRGFTREALGDHAPAELDLLESITRTLIWANGSCWPVKGGIFLSTSAPPLAPILHTCRESRAHTIRKYDLQYVFGTMVNPSKDVVFVDSSPSIQNGKASFAGIESFAALLKHKQLLRKLKSLAFHSDHQTLWYQKFSSLVSPHLDSLVAILFVHYGDNGYGQDHDLDREERCGRNLFLEDITTGNAEPEKYAKLERSWNVSDEDHEVEYYHTLLGSSKPGQVRISGVQIDRDNTGCLESLEIGPEEASYEDHMFLEEFGKTLAPLMEDESILACNGDPMDEDIVEKAEASEAKEEGVSVPVKSRSRSTDDDGSILATVSKAPMDMPLRHQSQPGSACSASTYGQRPQAATVPFIRRNENTGRPRRLLQDSYRPDYGRRRHSEGYGRIQKSQWHDYRRHDQRNSRYRTDFDYSSHRAFSDDLQNSMPGRPVRPWDCDNTPVTRRADIRTSRSMPGAELRYDSQIGSRSRTFPQRIRKNPPSLTSRPSETTQRGGPARRSPARHMRSVNSIPLMPRREWKLDQTAENVNITAHPYAAHQTPKDTLSKHAMTLAQDASLTDMRLEQKTKHRTSRKEKQSDPSSHREAEDSHHRDAHIIDYRNFPASLMKKPPATRIMQMSSQVLNQVHQKPKSLEKSTAEVIILDDDDY